MLRVIRMRLKFLQCFSHSVVVRFPKPLFRRSIARAQRYFLQSTNNLKAFAGKRSMQDFLHTVLIYVRFVGASSLLPRNRKEVNLINAVGRAGFGDYVLRLRQPGCHSTYSIRIVVYSCFGVVVLAPVDLQPCYGHVRYAA